MDQFKNQEQMSSKDKSLSPEKQKAAKEFEENIQNALKIKMEQTAKKMLQLTENVEDDDFGRQRTINKAQLIVENDLIQRIRD